MKKLMRITTVGLSLAVFCRGLLRRLNEREGYEVVAVSSPDADLKTTGRREGVRTVGVAMERRMAPLADLRSLVRLVGVMRRERPDMVHTMTPKAGLLGMMAARIAGVPVRIHTFTGLLFPTATGLKRRLLRLTDRLTCACATHIIPEGEGVKADLTAAGITRKPMRVLGHGNVRGIDPDHYDRTPEVMAEAAAIRRRLGIPDGARVLVYVGRFVGDKGLRELLEAFAALPSDLSDTHLLMVGAPEGGADDIPAQLIAQTPRVSVSGGWTDDVRPWLAAADGLVFPSYREGFPNVVIEAGAMGLPAVVTDINGSREIVERGRTGWIVPPREAGALREAMTELLRLSPAERAAMSERARRSVIERFNIELVQQSLIDFYRTLK